MICVKSAKNGRFSVGMITSKNLPALPVLENGYETENLPQCSVTTLDPTTYQLNIYEPDMIKCGVYYCDSDTETNVRKNNLIIYILEYYKESLYSSGNYLNMAAWKTINLRFDLPT